MAKQGDIIIIEAFRGQNVEKQPFAIDDSEAQIATNVIVKDSAIEIRGGLQLFVDQSATRTGGISMMRAFYKRDGTEQLIFANDDDYFFVTPSNQTPQTIGDYGTAVDNPTAFQYKDQIIFGTGATANTPKKWDGTTFSNITTPADSNSDLRFYTQFNGRNIRFLIGAGSSADNANENSTTLHFTPDPDDWATAPAGNLQVGPSDGTDITGVIQQDLLIAYKDKSKHYLDSFYEDSSATFSLRINGVDTSSGSPNHESLMPIDNDVVTLTDRFKSIEAYGRQGTEQGNSRPKQFATNINPVIEALTWQKTIIEKSRSINFNRLMLHAVPFNGSQTNNAVLVGHPDQPTINGQPSWTTWGMRAGSLEIFRDEDEMDQLYIGDSLQPKIYKYDPNIYSDNDFGYTRIWRSKKFNLKQRPDYDRFNWVIIEGAMRTITELTMKLIVDGREQEYVIDKTQLVESGGVSGAHIGDRLIGDEIIGGNSAETDKFRFMAVAQVPNALTYAKNVEIEFRNDEPGQFWKVDHLSLNLPINMENIPDNHKALRTT